MVGGWTGSADFKQVSSYHAHPPTRPYNVVARGSRPFDLGVLHSCFGEGVGEDTECCKHIWILARFLPWGRGAGSRDFFFRDPDDFHALHA